MLLAVLTFSVFFACKKKDKAPASTVVGFWKGTYNTSYPYPMLFRSNGAVRVFSASADTVAAQKGEGTYTVSGTTVNITCWYLTGVMGQNSTTGAVNNVAFTTMSGTWGSGTNTTDGGPFSLTKE